MNLEYNLTNELLWKDLNGPWDKKVDHNAPLFPRQGQTVNQSYLNVDWGVNYWLEKGCPKEKLILGLATYGRAFKLEYPNNYQLESPATGPALPGTVINFLFWFYHALDTKFCF